MSEDQPSASTQRTERRSFDPSSSPATELRGGFFGKVWEIFINAFPRLFGSSNTRTQPSSNTRGEPETGAEEHEASNSVVALDLDSINTPAFLDIASVNLSPYLPVPNADLARSSPLYPIPPTVSTEPSALRDSSSSHLEKSRRATYVENFFFQDFLYPFAESPTDLRWLPSQLDFQDIFNLHVVEVQRQHAITYPNRQMEPPPTDLYPHFCHVITHYSQGAKVVRITLPQNCEAIILKEMS